MFASNWCDLDPNALFRSHPTDDPRPLVGVVMDEINSARELLLQSKNPDAKVAINHPELGIKIHITLADLDCVPAQPKLISELLPTIQKYRIRTDPLRTYKIFLILALMNQLIPNQPLPPINEIKRVSKAASFEVFLTLIVIFTSRFTTPYQSHNNFSYCLSKENYERFIDFLKRFGGLYGWAIRDTDFNSGFCSNILPEVPEDTVALLSNDDLCLGSKIKSKKLVIVVVDQKGFIKNHEIIFARNDANEDRWRKALTVIYYDNLLQLELSALDGNLDSSPQQSELPWDYLKEEEI